MFVLLRICIIVMVPIISLSEYNNTNLSLHPEFLTLLSNLKQELNILRDQVEQQKHKIKQIKKKQKEYNYLNKNISDLYNNINKINLIISNLKSTSSPTWIYLSAELLYKNALIDIKDKYIDNALGKLIYFKMQYVDHVLIPDVIYWIGECYLSQNKYVIANRYFKQIIDSYKEHSKAADSIYKRAISFDRQGKIKEAIALLDIVIKNYNKVAPYTVEKAKFYHDDLIKKF